MSLLIKLPLDATADEIVDRIADEQHRPRCSKGVVARCSDANESLIAVIASGNEGKKRKGRVQSAIAGLFRAQPDRVFTAVDLALAVHGETTRTTCKTIRRAADGVAKDMGWMRRKMWGRVDYVRSETVTRATRVQAQKAARSLELDR